MPELCVVMAICRQTFGWHKKSEKLSVAQLREMTGLSKDAVLRALDAALEHGWITRKPAGQTYRYTVHVHEVEVRETYHLQEVEVREKDRYAKPTGTGNVPVSGTGNVPAPVRETYLQQESLKKGKETVKESTTARAVAKAPVQSAPTPTPAVAIYEEIFERKANSNQRQAITDTVTDCAKWRDVLTTWALKGHSPTNVVDQLDVYANGWQRKNTNGHAPPPPEPKPTRRMTQPIFAKEQP